MQHVMCPKRKRTRLCGAAYETITLPWCYTLPPWKELNGEEQEEQEAIHTYIYILNTVWRMKHTESGQVNN